MGRGFGGRRGLCSLAPSQPPSPRRGALGLASAAPPPGSPSSSGAVGGWSCASPRPALQGRGSHRLEPLEGYPGRAPLPAAPPAHQRVRCGWTLEPSGPGAPDSAPDSAQSSPLPGTPSWAWGEGWERTVWSRGPGARTLPKLPAGHRGSARAGCLLGQAACPPGPSTLVPGSCPIRELS